MQQIKILFILFIYWLSWVFVAARRLSLVARGGHPLGVVAGFSLQWPLTLHSAPLGMLWHSSFAAPRNVGSSQTRNQTPVPHIGRQTLIHWTPKEVPAADLNRLFVIEGRISWRRSRQPTLAFLPGESHG